MDRFRAAEIFRAIVECGSYTGAAKILGLSRSHLSKLIKELEDSLGARLLNRSTRQVRLTALGRDYYRSIVRILEDFRGLEESIRFQQSHVAGAIKVLAPKSFGVTALVRVVERFIALYPDVEITIYLLDQDRDISEHGFDLALRYGAQADSTYISRKICSVRFIACAAPDYLKRRGVPKVPDDLARHQCLRNVISAKNSTWKFCGPEETVQVAVRGALAANTSLPLREAALRGLGIGLFPRFGVEEDLKKGTLVEVLANYRVPELPLYAIYPDRNVTAKLRVFIGFLASSFGESLS
jgi:DNA-binding transcriptional LysR family regulator